jgi:hypothetical protein
MNIEYIILQVGCGKQIKPYVIKLETRYKDSWDEKRIKAVPIDPTQIISVLVGPKTVLEYYDTSNFVGSKRRVINSSDKKVKGHKFDCPEDPTWKGFVRSFIVMTYDYYNKVYGTQYCEHDSDCGQYQKCMCSGGHTHPSQCPSEKRRCMHPYGLINESPIALKNTDQVDYTCLNKELASYKQDNVTYGLLTNAAMKCAKNPTIEPFSISYRNDPYVIASFILVIVLLIVISYSLMTC